MARRTVAPVEASEPVCDICQLEPRARPTYGDEFRKYACCRACADLSPDYYAPTPPLWLAFAMFRLRRTLKSMPFHMERPRDESAAVFSIQAAWDRVVPEAAQNLSRGGNRVGAWGGPQRQPDLVMHVERTRRVAIEVKFPNRKNMAGEVARGLGQCVMYCVGSPKRHVEDWDEGLHGKYYASAALVVIESVEKPSASISVENVLRTSGPLGDTFWVYEFRCECPR